nr:NACHT, LRR and PYD domains-containing protein 3 isoform X2 [Danio rerio]|eukprot:XP_021325112.1 NACHT, LRR and PYD domains-containing protein 3 isoform X2 [Danio rerio]
MSEMEGASPKMSLPEKHRMRSGSHAPSSVSMKSDWSMEKPPDLTSEGKPASTTSFLSLKSDWSMEKPPDLTCKRKLMSTKRLLSETQDFQAHKNHKNFTDNLQEIFKNLESQIISFLTNEFEMFKKILLRVNTNNFVKDFNENRCSIREAALDLTLYFLREMKQDEAADTLEDELFFIHQLKCGLQKKYQCVFEGIAQQGDSTLLKNIYTDLYITQGGSEQVNTKHEVRQIEVTSRHHEAQEIQVECRHLFEASEQDKQIRTVLTKGVAGIGKSVSVQKFVLDWAEGKENQEISFIFPLPFREMNLKEKETLSLMELITQFYPETKGLNLTRRNRFKVLFILDGLDECRLPLNFAGNETCCDVSSPVSLDVLLTNLIKGNLLPSALIWITSRPAAASKIPPDCIDRVTEVRGFNDEQKVEYFRKRLTDENQAKEIIDHVKQSKSLFIMCHIPVFCWISATVLQNFLQEKRNNDVKHNQADSKTLQESNTEDTPKTLTQMYTHFLRFQIQQSRRKYDGENTPDVSWDKDAILSLGKLAFQQLLNSNLIFYDTDLEACGIDVYKASVYSGMCTQIFKKETGIVLGTMYCFVHLSVQEFIAALYAHLILDINKKSVFDQDSRNRNESMIDLLKTAVDKALESDNGHLDLFLRFLLGLSLQSNRRLLRGLFAQHDHNNKWNIWSIWKIFQYFFRTADQQQDHNDLSKEEIVQYLKQKFEANLSPERSINLFYCLNELNDQTLVKEIQTRLSKGSLSSADLSPAQWSALAFVLLTSEEEMEEFELQKFKKSDECLIRLSAVIKTSKRALLSKCNLTEESCSALASVLRSDSSSLKDLDLSNNNLQDSGVKLLSDGLKDNCKLEKLGLSDCSISEEGYKALASALRSNPSHLIELDLRGNDPGPSGVKELTDALLDTKCKAKLRFLSSAADEFCQFVTGIMGKNPLLLKELNLSDRELGDTRVNQLSDLLQDKHCQINTLMLKNNRITAEGCADLMSAFNSNPSHLTELNLSVNELGDLGVEKICPLLENTLCRLEKLNLSDCSITGQSYETLASVLRSNLYLKELDLRGNDPGKSGVKKFIDFLQEGSCKLQIIRFLKSPDAEEACEYLTKDLVINPLLLTELDLSKVKLGHLDGEKFSAFLMDSHNKVEKIKLNNCKLTEKSCSVLAAVLSSKTILKEMNLNNSRLLDSGVRKICEGLKNPVCELKILKLLSPAADEACSFVAVHVGENPLLLKELNLSNYELGDPRVNQLSALLQDKHCKLNTLMLSNCGLTEESCSALASVLRSDSCSLKDLDLSNNNLQNSGVKRLSDGLKDNCKLEKLRLSDCSISEGGYKALASALRSNLSHLIELDLRGNDPGQSGVKELTDLLQDPHCTLKTLRFLSSAVEEVCKHLSDVLTGDPLILKELNLGGCKIEDKVSYLATLLQDKHCQISTLVLNNTSITEEGCANLTSAITLNPSHLRELNLSDNKLGDSAVKNLSDLLIKTQFKLEKLHLSNCSITEEQCVILTSALKSNPSHLRELNLSVNEMGDSAVKNLRDFLMKPQCNLEKLLLRQCSITEKQCEILTSALKSNPSHLRELDLSRNEINNTGVNLLSEVLKDSHCKLERLSLIECGITDVSSFAHNLMNTETLKELDLRNNSILISRRKLLYVLSDSNCKLSLDKGNLHQRFAELFFDNQ